MSSSEQDLTKEEIEEIEETREQRLDPDSRPENAEVDNSERSFDSARGHFTDSEEYDESEAPQFSDAEDPNNPDNQPDQANPEWTSSEEED